MWELERHGWGEGRGKVKDVGGGRTQKGERIEMGRWGWGRWERGKDNGDNLECRRYRTSSFEVP